MQINSGVKQHEDKSVLLAFWPVKSKGLVYLLWTLSYPLNNKTGEEMDWQKQKSLMIFNNIGIHPPNAKTIYSV